MSDAIWYYVDRAQQRQGPVTADALVEAWHAGDASDQSLVWREGMSDWRPLAEHRGELGLGDAAPAYAPPPASPPGPLPPAGTPVGVSAAKPAPAKSNSGCLILGIVAVIGLIAVIGIIAAVALPAYQDYVERAKEAAEAMESGETDYGTDDGSAGESDVEGYVDLDGEDGDTAFSAGSAPVSAAIAEGRAHQAQVDDFFANTDRCPRDADELALPAPATPGVRAYTVGVSETRMCTITIEFGGAEAGPLAGERIVLSRDGGGDWYCTSDMNDRSQLPSDCY